MVPAGDACKPRTVMKKGLRFRGAESSSEIQGELQATLSAIKTHQWAKLETLRNALRMSPTDVHQ